jgi:hypothetical protein
MTLLSTHQHSSTVINTSTVHNYQQNGTTQVINSSTHQHLSTSTRQQSSTDQLTSTNTSTPQHFNTPTHQPSHQQINLPAPTHQVRISPQHAINIPTSTHQLIHPHGLIYTQHINTVININTSTYQHIATVTQSSIHQYIDTSTQS